MPKGLDTTVLDALLDDIKTADRLVACRGIPASESDAMTLAPTGNALARIVVDGSGWTIGAGTPDGRKVTIPALDESEAVEHAGYWDVFAFVENGVRLIGTTVLDGNAPIEAVDTGADTITIEGDVVADIDVGQQISVLRSTGNDGVYTVSGVSEVGGNAVIAVEQDVSSAVADGLVVYGGQSLTAGNDLVLTATEITVRDPE